MPKFCHEAATALGLEKPQCCSSCHEDEWEGYSDLLWNDEYYVCCRMMTLLEEAGLWR